MMFRRWIVTALLMATSAFATTGLDSIYNAEDRPLSGVEGAVSPGVKYPKMPSSLELLLHEDWKALNVDDILNKLKSPGVMEFAHGRDTFYSHLRGTYGILKAWGQPDDICLLGMTHTAYGGDLFQFFFKDSLEDRSFLRDLIGAEAEALTYLFGTIHRGQLGGLQDVMTNATSMIPLRGDYVVKHRIEGSTTVSSKTAAKILIATIADYLDQMVEQNGWRDHHQVEAPVDQFYPGDGRPTLALNWFSQVCHAIRDQLDAVPPIFDYCTKTLPLSQETKARDYYWNVTIREHDLSDAEQMGLLYQAIEHNPFVGEPHILLAQLYFRKGEYQHAAEHCRKALEKLYVLASAWDKRRSFAQWVGFARVLMLRANRQLKDLPHLPYYDSSNVQYTSAKGKHLISLHVLAREMKSYEE